MKQNSFYAKYIKRLLDILLSAGALLFLWPVLLVTAILVRLTLGSPVIFRQARPGKDEKIFRLYKFRTMTDEKDANGNLLPDDIRLTKFGRLLRSTSLDELPELWNILKGDMSIVGPRPLLVKYLPLYNEEQKHRHDVAPVSPAGPRPTAAMPSAGRKSSVWMCGMFKICVSKPM